MPSRHSLVRSPLLALVVACSVAACAANGPRPGDAAPSSRGGSPAGPAQGERAAAGDSQTMIAEIALQRGDCRAASESYARAAASGDAALARRATEVALSCNHLPAAWDALARWRKLAPDAVEAATLQAAVALKLYRLADARAAIEAVLRTRLSDERQAKLLEALARESDAGAVLAALPASLDSPVTPVPVLVMLGQLSLQSFQLDRASRYADRAIARGETDGDALRIRARVQVARGDAQAAISTAHEVAAAKPVAGVFELSEILTALDRLEEARQELERLRATDVPDAEIDRRLALLALQGGDVEEAQRRLLELAQSGQASEAALFYLSDLAERQGNVDLALEGFRRLADASVGLEARSRAAMLLLARKDRGAALSLLDDFAAKYPDKSFDVVLAKVRVLAQGGEPATALEVLGAALERHPQHPTLEYERATTLEAAGRTKDAVQAFERILARRPGDPVVMNALGYTLADHSLELPRAEELIRRALAAFPDNPAMLDSLGWVRFRRGDTAGALKALERAYALSRDPEVASHWGEVLWKSGDEQAARKVWAGALARTPGSKPLKATLARLLPPETP